MDGWEDAGQYSLSSQGPGKEMQEVAKSGMSLLSETPHSCGNRQKTNREIFGLRTPSYS